MSYQFPRNQSEYWNTVHTYWEPVSKIIEMFVPKCLQEAEHFRTQEDGRLVNILEEAWESAPDSPGIHSIPGWHVLCDLCSESYLLYSEDEEW